MRTALFLLSWLLLPSWAIAQLEYTARIEFKTTYTSNENFDVLPLNKEGLLVTVHKNEFYRDEKWYFYRYDNALKERWVVEYDLGDDMKPFRSYHNQNYLYWYFKDEDHHDKFTVLRLDLANGYIDNFKGNLHSDIEVSQFKVLGNMALIGGYVNSKPVVLGFSFFDKSIKTFPYLFLPNTEINSIEIDETRNEMTVILYSLKKRNCELSLKTYSYEGKLLKTLNLPAEKDNGLISGKIVQLTDNDVLLVGNYSHGCTPYSQGIYFSRVKDGTIEPAQWVDFSQLENFFNYLKPNKKQRVLEKINRQKENGKEPRFRYKLITHDIIETPTEYVLLAEIYYPAYSNKISTTYNFSNNRIAEFQAYKYTHAFVCGFDKISGKLLWDNCFGLEDVESFQSLEVAQVTQQEGKLILAYPHKGKIHTEVIERNKVVREKEVFEIKPPSIDEKITDNEEEQLAAWYDNNFILFGYQKIKLENGTGPSRDVFYVNKVVYDAHTPVNK